MNHSIADFHFLLLVHEGFADVGVVPVAQRRAADKRRPVGDRLLLFSRRKILAGREDRRGRADRAHRRHVDMLGGKGDERTGRAGVGVDVGVSRDRGVIQNAGDFLRRIELAAVGIHVQDDRGGAAALGGLFRAPDKERERGRNFPVQRDDHDVAPADHRRAPRPPA